MTSKTKILLGCDGFGEELKNQIKIHLVSNEKFQVVDYGCAEYYSVAAKIGSIISEEVLGNNNGQDKSVGILVCGTGMGVGIIANKFKGVSAATCENVKAAVCSRAVNDANILCLGGKVTSSEDAIVMVDAFLKQPYIAAPCSFGEDCKQKPEWWGDDVESFLKGSKKGIEDTLVEYGL